MVKNVAVVLGKTLLVSLDDLPAVVVRGFLNPHVSRSGLDRWLRRHGVANLRDLQAEEVRRKPGGFKACEPGCLHVDVKDLPQMADESLRRCIVVAIGRMTRWVFIRIFRARRPPMPGTSCATWSAPARSAFAPF